MISANNGAGGRLVSLNVGGPQPLLYRGRSVPSGIRKSPVSGPLWLGESGLEDDVQADRENHGGPDNAVCVYSLDRYPYWSARLGRTLGTGAFGENFGVEGLTETEVCVGDVYRVGGAVAQVSQPRRPCYKLAARHGVPQLASWVVETGFTGFYLRCLVPGEVRAGDAVVLAERPAPGVSVAEANRVMHREKRDLAAVERLLAVSELAASWRGPLEKRLSGPPEG